MFDHVHHHDGIDRFARNSRVREDRRNHIEIKHSFRMPSHGQFRIDADDLPAIFSKKRHEIAEAAAKSRGGFLVPDVAWQEISSWSRGPGPEVLFAHSMISRLFECPLAEVGVESGDHDVVGFTGTGICIHQSALLADDNLAWLRNTRPK